MTPIEQVLQYGYHTPSDAEQEELVRIFSSPVVINYLRKLTGEAVMDRLALGNDTKLSDAQFVKEDQRVLGGLAVLETLLEISQSK